jgi:hypothetical protein
VFLAVVKVVDPQLFEALLHQRISYGEVSSTLRLAHLGDESERGRKLPWLMEWIRYALLREREFNDLAEDDEIKGFGRSLWQYNVSRERLIPIFAQQLSMFVVT